MKVRNILVLLVILLALGGVYYYINIPEPVVPPEPRFYAWLIEMDDIQRITISLPREGKSQSFIKIPKEDTFPWYFDDPERSPVDTKRWGGGIPLLLSGPGVERIISKNTAPEKLAEYGISEPRLTIMLGLTDNKTMTISVGDKTPAGSAYYVLAPNTNNDVATVDESWYEVLANLVNNPPHAAPAP